MQKGQGEFESIGSRSLHGAVDPLVEAPDPCAAPAREGACLGVPPLQLVLLALVPGFYPGISLEEAFAVALSFL